MSFSRGPSYRVVSLGYKTPCWIWLRYVSPKGYGQLWQNGTMAKAHRVYYERYKGPIPDNLTIDHLCFNKDCVNPEHLEAVTFSENSKRGKIIGYRKVMVRPVTK